MLSKSFILVSSIAALTAALPTELQPRVCGIVNLPSTLIQLKQSAPDTSFPNTAHTDNTVVISQDDGATNKVNELIAFNSPPAGSYGCSLGITFPSNYVFKPSSGASPTLNVYTVPTVPASPTWNNVAKGPLFGTVTVLAGQSTVINSQSCPGAGQLGFVFGYADWITGKASVGWDEYINALNGAGLRGVYLSYNC